MARTTTQIDVDDAETNDINNDMVLTGKIAGAYVEEFPDYYMRLERLALEADAYPTPRRSSPTACF